MLFEMSNYEVVFNINLEEKNIYTKIETFSEICNAHISHLFFPHADPVDYPQEGKTIVFIKQIIKYNYSYKQNYFRSQQPGSEADYLT